MRKTFIAALLAGIAAGPVLAQTTTSPGGTGTTTSPGTMTAPGAADTAGSGAIMPGPGNIAPLSMASAGQMLGSDVRGTRVYGGNNESIGEVDDILIDRDGRVVALIIGVGGFLGIGEKYVAIPMQAFEVALERETTASTRADSTASRSGTAGTGTSTGTPTSAVAARSASTTRYGTTDPDHLVLRNMTKADLQNAPAFGRSGSGSGTGTGSGSGSAPRQ